MTWRLEGATIPSDERAQTIDRLLAQWRPEPQPLPRLPLQIAVGRDANCAICCAGPCVAIERWRVGVEARRLRRGGHRRARRRERRLG